MRWVAPGLRTAEYPHGTERKTIELERFLSHRLELQQPDEERRVEGNGCEQQRKARRNDPPRIPQNALQSEER